MLTCTDVIWQLVRYGLAAAIIYGMSFLLEETYQAIVAGLVIYLAISYLE